MSPDVRKYGQAKWEKSLLFCTSGHIRSITACLHHKHISKSRKETEVMIIYFKSSFADSSTHNRVSVAPESYLNTPSALI